MLVAAVLTNADQPALKIEKKPSTVFVWAVAADILALLVADALVAGEILAGLAIELGFVRHDASVGANVALENVADVLGGHTVNVLGAGLATTLNQGDDLALTGWPTIRANAALLAGGASSRADMGLVHLNRTTVAADWRGVRVRHRLTDAMRHEPRRLVGDPEQAVELVGAEPLLASRHEMRGR